MSAASSALRSDGPCNASSGTCITKLTRPARRSSAVAAGSVASVASVFGVPVRRAMPAGSAPTAKASELSAANTHASRLSPSRCEITEACSSPVTVMCAALVVSAPKVRSRVSNATLVPGMPGIVVGIRALIVFALVSIAAAAGFASLRPRRICIAAGSLEPPKNISPFHTAIAASNGGGAVARPGVRRFISAMSVRAQMKPVPGRAKRSVVAGPGSSTASASLVSFESAGSPTCNTPAPGGIDIATFTPPSSGE